MSGTKEGRRSGRRKDTQGREGLRERGKKIKREREREFRFGGTSQE